MTEPLFLKPVLQEKIWGGDHLKTVFGYDIPSNHTGELWAISAHSHGPSTVLNGPFAGKTLNEVWDSNREVFGNAKGDVFPLLTKILDANQDLSVQVHPDDTYAMQHEHELGKTECWYVISAEPGAELIYGHHAKTREELAEMIHDEKWDDLFTHVPVKAGDFFYVPSGTIHAIGSGVMVLETQQSSDTTYRVYDFDRVDATTGKKRDLHIQQSIDVTNVPNKVPELDIQTKMVGDAKVTTFVKTPFFSVYEWLISDGSASFKRTVAPYTLVSVLKGEGQIKVDDKTFDLKMGMHFILPNEVKDWTITGDMQIIASEPGEKA